MLRQISFEEMAGKTVRKPAGGNGSYHYVVFEDDTFVVLRAEHGRYEGDSAEIAEPQISLETDRRCFDPGDHDICVELGIYTEAEHAEAQTVLSARRQREAEDRDRAILRQLKARYGE